MQFCIIYCATRGPKGNAGCGDAREPVFACLPLAQAPWHPRAGRHQRLLVQAATIISNLSEQGEKIKGCEPRLGIVYFPEVPADEPIGLEDPRWLALEFKPEDSAADASTRSLEEGFLCFRPARLGRGPGAPWTVCENLTILRDTLPLPYP